MKGGELNEPITYFYQNSNRKHAELYGKNCKRGGYTTNRLKKIE